MISIRRSRTEDLPNVLKRFYRRGKTRFNVFYSLNVVFLFRVSELYLSATNKSVILFFHTQAKTTSKMCETAASLCLFYLCTFSTDFNDFSWLLTFLLCQWVFRTTMRRTTQQSKVDRLVDSFSSLFVHSVLELFKNSWGEGRVL